MHRYESRTMLDNKNKRVVILDESHRVSISYNHTYSCEVSALLCDPGLPPVPASYMHGLYRYNMCVCGYQNTQNWINGTRAPHAFRLMRRNAVNPC